MEKIRYIRWTIKWSRNGASNYETTLSILEFQARKNGSITQQKAKQCARITGEFGGSVRGILFEGLDGWTKTYKDRPKLLESRRPTPPVSSLPPCFPNSKGLHQVISIPIALRWEMRSKLFKSINKNLHCDTLWSFWWTLQRVQSAFKSGMSISMFSPDVGIFSCTRCMCVCAWLHDLIICNV